MRESLRKTVEAVRNIEEMERTGEPFHPYVTTHNGLLYIQVGPATEVVATAKLLLEYFGKEGVLNSTQAEGWRNNDS